MKTVDWKRIVDDYERVKKLYLEYRHLAPEIENDIDFLENSYDGLDNLVKLIAVDKINELKGVNTDSAIEKLTQALENILIYLCDMLFACYMEKITVFLLQYCSKVKKDVIPDYYTKIKPSLEEMKKTVSSFSEEDKRRNIAEYESIVDTLGTYWGEIFSRESSLEELESNERKARKRNRLTALIIPLIIGGVTIAVAVIGLIL